MCFKTLGGLLWISLSLGFPKQRGSSSGVELALLPSLGLCGRWFLNHKKPLCIQFTLLQEGSGT